MTRVIIKITFKNLAFLAHVERYIEYYNRFLASRDNNDLYLELLQDGFIFIYKDLDIYYKRVCPFTIDEQAQIRAFNFPNDPFFLKLFYPRESFPKEGIRFLYSLVLGDTSKIYNRSVDYFKSVSPKIQITPTSPTEGEIFIPVYEGILDYLRITAWKYLLPR